MNINERKVKNAVTTSQTKHVKTHEKHKSLIK